MDILFNMMTFMADALTEPEALLGGLTMIGAGLATLGMLGAGLGQGFAAGKAAEAVGRNPEAEDKIRSMFIIGAAIAETAAIYALVVAILILFM